MTEPCHDCARQKRAPDPGQRLRWCADGNHRCTAHRADWLEKQHAENQVDSLPPYLPDARTQVVMW